MSDYDEYNNLDELIRKAKQAIGHPFKDFDKNKRLNNTKNKGHLGQIIEEGLFGYKINSNQEPDFNNLGVELKVTPYKKVNNGNKISAKERLVLTIINYMNDYDVEFVDSNCYHKLDKILMMFYEHEPEKMTYEFIISKIYLYMFDQLIQEDKEIILNDYYYILDKIRMGKAHEISESDTMYLGACTKGSTSEKSMVPQPFSNIKAKQRAFSLKTSYMTQLLRTDDFNRNAFVKNLNDLKSKSLKEIIENTFKPFYGMSLDEIDKLIDGCVNRKSLNYLRSYVAFMLNVVDINPEELDEFAKANIKIKTIRVNTKGNIKESMSFPAFKFLELVNENWENSSLRNQFIEEKYLFCIFDEVDCSQNNYIFRGAIIWTMPESDLDSDVAFVWRRTKALALKGIEFTKVRQKNGIIIKNNLPKKSDDKIIHVRPHANKAVFVSSEGEVIGNGNVATDGDLLPNGIVITKQCFFINNSYILRIIDRSFH